MLTEQQKTWLWQLGKTLQSLRKDKKISQDELAKRSAISRRTLVSLEKGKGCTLETLLSVMDGLGESHQMDKWLGTLSPIDIPMAEEGSSRRKKHFRSKDRAKTQSH